VKVNSYTFIIKEKEQRLVGWVSR